MYILNHCHAWKHCWNINSVPLSCVYCDLRHQQGKLSLEI